MIDLSILYSWIGILLSFIGAVKLGEPMVLSNSLIKKMAAGFPKKENAHLVKSLKESRDKTFIGISLLFMGFSFAIIQPSLQLGTSLSHAISPLWWNVNATTILAVILCGDWIIINRMKKRREELEAS